MNKFKRNYFLIIITLTLIISSITLNINTISQAETRIIAEKTNTPITELITKEENLDEQETKEETNSYNNKELLICITTPIAISMCLVLLISTSLGKYSLKEVFNSPRRFSYSIILLVVLSVILPTTNIVLSDKEILNSKVTLDRHKKTEAIVEITNDKKNNAIKEESTENNKSVVQISNQSNYILNKFELSKSNGTSTDIEVSEYFGLNSAVIIKDGSNATLTNGTITTKTDYSTALFLTGLSTTATLKNININTINDNSYGISISEEGKVIGNNITLVTTGINSSPIKVLDPNSEIKITNGSITSDNINSPLFLSNGKIEIDKVTGKSHKSPIGIIKNSNCLYITNSELTTSTSSEDKIYASAFTIYNDSKGSSNSFSSTSLTIKDSKITIDKESTDYKKLPLFYIKGGSSKINITDSKFKYGSKILLSIESESEENISEVTITADDQTLKGNIVSDKYSKVRLNLNNSTFKGRINKGNISKNIDVTFDSESKWIVTGTSYVNTLTVTKKDLYNVRKYIISNGYNVYYNAKENEWLNGRTIYLQGGGRLIPKYYKN